jgi:hypothetical protein
MRNARQLLCTLFMLAATPVSAQEVMTAEMAKDFVAGKFFSFKCFEGTLGSGRIMADGSAAGRIRFAGTKNDRNLRVPEGTLYISGDRICATLAGLPFDPCFTLWRTGSKSFRGAFSAWNSMYCDFTREGRTLLARRRTAPQTTGSLPTSITPNAP